MPLKWNGPDYLRYVGRAADAYLKAMGTEHKAISRADAGVANTGQTVKITRPRKGGRKSSRTIYPNSSKPGEPPRRRTGFGQKNIVGGYSKARKIWRTGYTRAARYMTFWELGIRTRGGTVQRPTVVPALMRNRNRLVMIGRRAAQSVRT